MPKTFIRNCKEEELVSNLKEHINQLKTIMTETKQTHDGDEEADNEIKKMAEGINNVIKEFDKLTKYNGKDLQLCLGSIVDKRVFNIIQTVGDNIYLSAVVNNMGEDFIGTIFELEIEPGFDASREKDVILALTSFLKISPIVCKECPLLRECLSTVLSTISQSIDCLKKYQSGGIWSKMLCINYQIIHAINNLAESFSSFSTTFATHEEYEKLTNNLNTLAKDIEIMNTNLLKEFDSQFTKASLKKYLRGDACFHIGYVLANLSTCKDDPIGIIEQSLDNLEPLDIILQDESASAFGENYEEKIPQTAWVLYMLTQISNSLSEFNMGDALLEEDGESGKALRERGILEFTLSDEVKDRINTLTLKNKVKIWLHGSYDLREKPTFPLCFTGKGISEGTEVKHGYVSRCLKEMYEKGLVNYKMTNINGSAPQKRGYYLTELGMNEVIDILRNCELNEDELESMKNVRNIQNRRTILFSK